jgi:uncharacterized membrane protein required for colicin V production
MHTIDIILSVIGVIFVIIGIKRGLSGELIRIIAMVAGFIGAFIYYSDVTVYLSSLKIPLAVKNAISFFLIYAVIVLLILIIGWIIKKIINMTVLGWADRALGAVVGIFKAMIVAWILCLAISSFPAKRVQNDLSNSYTFRIYKKLPASFHLDSINKIRESARKFFNSKSPESIDKTKDKLESIHDTLHRKK